MRTPWSKLLQYGAGIATIAVICASAIILLAVVGLAVVLTKMSEFIK